MHYTALAPTSLWPDSVAISTLSGHYSVVNPPERRSDQPNTRVPAWYVRAWASWFQNFHRRLQVPFVFLLFAHSPVLIPYSTGLYRHATRLVSTHTYQDRHNSRTLSRSPSFTTHTTPLTDSSPVALHVHAISPMHVTPANPTRWVLVRALALLV